MSELNLEELKRLHTGIPLGQNSYDFYAAIYSAFPAILARLEAQDKFINQVKYELHRANPDDLAVNLLNHLRELR